MGKRFLFNQQNDIDSNKGHFKVFYIESIDRQWE